MKMYCFAKNYMFKKTSELYEFLQKNQFVCAIIASLFIISILTLMWGVKKSTLTFVISCYLLTGLIFICKNKIIGGGYILFITFICNIPSLFIQNLHDSAVKTLQYYEYFQNWNFTFALIFSAFACVVFINIINKRLYHNVIVTLTLRIISSFVLLLPSFYSVCYLINWIMGNPTLEINAVLAFYQTNFSEAVSYCKDMVVFKRALLVFLILIITYLLAYKTVSTSFLKFNRYSYSIFFMCILISYNGFDKFRYNSYTAPFADAREVLNAFSEYSDLTRLRANDINNFKDCSKNTFEGTYVVVIGESESRVNMNCYGYKENNTPFQTELKKNNNSIFFNNAFSNHTHTVPVLSYALTSKNQYNNKDLAVKDIVSLVDVARYNLGYHTVWLSNQNKIGVWENPLSAIAESSDEKIWSNEFSLLNYSDKMYDEIILEYFDKINLSSKRNIIFIHLMGSHASYADRYPQSFAKFKSDSETVNNYNNSIYYNDNVLQLILQKAEKLPNFKGLLYFSDHGDDAEKGIYHNSAQFTYPMAEIPLWMYFSDSYISEHKIKFDSLKSHVDTPFTNDLIFDTVLGILGAQKSEFYCKNNDLSSMEYNHSIHDLKTLHGKKSLSDAQSSKMMQ